MNKQLTWKKLSSIKEEKKSKQADRNGNDVRYTKQLQIAVSTLEG